jgi:hypothetical protein
MSKIHNQKAKKIKAKNLCLLAFFQLFLASSVGYYKLNKVTITNCEVVVLLYIIISYERKIHYCPRRKIRLKTS